MIEKISLFSGVNLGILAVISILLFLFGSILTIFLIATGILAAYYLVIYLIANGMMAHDLTHKKGFNYALLTLFLLPIFWGLVDIQGLLDFLMSAVHLSSH